MSQLQFDFNVFLFGISVLCIKFHLNIICFFRNLVAFFDLSKHIVCKLNYFQNTDKLAKLPTYPTCLETCKYIQAHNNTMIGLDVW